MPHAEASGYPGHADSEQQVLKCHGRSQARPGMPCRLSTGSLPPQALSSVPEEPHSLHGSSSTSSLTEDKLMELCQQQQQQQGPACSGGVPLCREARQDRESLDSDFLLQLRRGPRKGRSRPSRGDSARGELMRHPLLCCTQAAL